MKEAMYKFDEFEALSTDKEDKILIKFKGDLISPTGEKNGTLKNKAKVNCKLAVYLYRLISSYLVSTHFEKQKSETEILVSSIDELPFYIKIVNWQNKQKLSAPQIEYLRDDVEEPTPVDKETILQEELTDHSSMLEIRRNTVKINAVLADFFKRRGLDLTTLRLRFGRIDKNMGICRPITFDRCELKEIDGSQMYDLASLNKNSQKAEQLYTALDERIIY